MKPILIFLALTLFITWPTFLSPVTTVYTPLDHITTDMYSAMSSLWYPTLGDFSETNMLCAPYSQRTPPVFLLGLLMAPLTRVGGPIFSHNLLTWWGLFSSAFFAFLLSLHLTKRQDASILAGIIFGFCPYMLLRAYTTFDTIQAGWIPLYILCLFRYTERSTWERAFAVGGALLGATFLSYPYYVVFFPILTAIYFAFFQKGFRKIFFVGSAVFMVFAAYYTAFLRMPAHLPTASRTPAHQRELKLVPADYLVPVQQSALFGSMTRSYWDRAYRAERRVSLNCAAYVGWIALGLALYGAFRNVHDRTSAPEQGRRVGFFGIVAGTALIVTLGPDYGLSQAMLWVAPFARRVSVYKIFVQLSVAVLAAYGVCAVSRRLSGAVLIALCGMVFLEFTTVPPFQTREVTRIPPAYEWLVKQPDGIVFEYPMFKASGQDYQGYMFYQMFHGKRLFNPAGNVGLSTVPTSMRGFWKKMETPMAITEQANIDTLRSLGVRYLVRHFQFSTWTVTFPPPPQPKEIPLKLVFPVNVPELHTWRFSTNPPDVTPFDYLYTEIYEL